MRTHTQYAPSIPRTRPRACHMRERKKKGNPNHRKPSTPAWPSKTHSRRNQKTVFERVKNPIPDVLTQWTAFFLGLRGPNNPDIPTQYQRKRGGVVFTNKEHVVKYDLYRRKGDRKEDSNTTHKFNFPTTSVGRGEMNKGGNEPRSTPQGRKRERGRRGSAWVQPKSTDTKFTKLLLTWTYSIGPIGLYEGLPS